MLDPEIIIEDPKRLEKMLRMRSINSLPDIFLIKSLIEKRKKTIGDIQGNQREKNILSKEIGLLLSKGEKSQGQKEQVKKITDEIFTLEEKNNKITTQLENILSGIPNWLDPEVPKGGEDANTLIKGKNNLPNFCFPPKTHYEIGEKQGLLDFEKGVKLAGSRFYSYWGKLAQLERVLLNFMIDLHTKEFKYTEVFVPILVNNQSMFTTGQFPKFSGEYYTLERDGLSLIPTAEVPLVNLYRNEIIDEKNLPITLVGASSCFRREAGAAGKDTRGLVRVHQFQKVELVQFVHPDTSEDVHQKMITHAEEVLIRLEIPYRVILKAAGDTGASAVKSYDLEVWMPGLKRWLEISSISNCWDYQARRGAIRFKNKQKGSKPKYIHTLNGSGIAAGRCMIAIMENYQKEDMDFDLPKVLKKYF